MSGLYFNFSVHPPRCDFLGGKPGASCPVCHQFSEPRASLQSTANPALGQVSGREKELECRVFVWCLLACTCASPPQHSSGFVWPHLAGCSGATPGFVLRACSQAHMQDRISFCHVQGKHLTYCALLILQSSFRIGQQTAQWCFGGPPGYVGGAEGQTHSLLIRWTGAVLCSQPKIP